MIPPEFMAKIVPQLEAFVAALPEESFFGGMGHPRTVEYACWDAEQRLRGKGVPIGVWW